MSFDPTDMNARDAITAIHNLDSTEDLLAAQAAEEAAGSRKTVLAAISDVLADIADEAEETAEAEAEEAEEAAEVAQEARAVADAAAVAAPAPIVYAPPNEGTVGILTKTFSDK